MRIRERLEQLRIIRLLSAHPFISRTVLFIVFFGLLVLFIIRVA